MVKRAEITYVGGHKEEIRYTTRYEEDARGRVLFGFHDKRIEVNMNNVLQIKELHGGTTLSSSTQTQNLQSGKSMFT